MQELPLTLYGSTTCEDTALVRAHLRALGISFADFDREDNARVSEILARHNNGNLVTPTLVFGDDAYVIAEPSLETLHNTLRDAGFAFQPLRAIEIRGELKNQRLPNFTLPSSAGGAVTLYTLPGRKRAVLFLVDDPSDRASQGYARQLTNHRVSFDEYNAVPLAILSADLETTKRWAHEFARGYACLSDAGGALKQKYAERFGVAPAGALLAILDSFCAPRTISHAPDAGGLIAPGEVLEWLRLLDNECDE